MRVQGAASNPVPARGRKDDPPLSRQERPGKKDGSADLLGKMRRDLIPRDVKALEAPSVVGKLFREHNFLTQMCGNNFMVLKAAPPLMVNEQQIADFVRAVKNVVEEVHSSSAFWMDALHMARRAVNV